MGVVQDYCPPEILAKNEYFDTLLVNVPYKGTDKHTVTVPPVADLNEPVIKSISSSVHLTHDNGEHPPDYKKLVGWWGDDERDWFATLEDSTREIHAALDEEDFHPAPKGPVKAMADQASNLLLNISRLYGKWANARMQTEDPGSGEYAQPDRDLDLGQSEGEIRDWAKQLTGLDAAGLAAAVSQRFEKYADLLGDLPETDYIGDPTPQMFWDAFLAARRRDRDKIRDWYRAIHKNLYCAEYGVAQSESYNRNKVEHGDALPLAPPPPPVRKPTRHKVVGGYAPPPTPPAPPPPPPCCVQLGEFVQDGVTFTGKLVCTDTANPMHGRLVSAQAAADGVNANVTMQSPGSSTMVTGLFPLCEEPDFGWPDMDLGEEEPLLPPPPPPLTRTVTATTETATTETAPTPFYKTTAAKVIFGVVGVAAVGGGSYAAYRYFQRRRTA